MLKILLTLIFLSSCSNVKTNFLRGKDYKDIFIYAPDSYEQEDVNNIKLTLIRENTSIKIKDVRYSDSTTTKDIGYDLLRKAQNFKNRIFVVLMTQNYKFDKMFVAKTTTNNIIISPLKSGIIAFLSKKQMLKDFMILDKEGSDDVNKDVVEIARATISSQNLDSSFKRIKTEYSKIESSQTVFPIFDTPHSFGNLITYVTPESLSTMTKKYCKTKDYSSVTFQAKIFTKDKIFFDKNDMNVVEKIEDQPKGSLNLFFVSGFLNIAIAFDSFADKYKINLKEGDLQVELMPICKTK